MNNNIHKLSPAAARLLLAFMAASPTDSYDDAVAESGIHSCLTLATAKKQLKNLGFVSEGENGEETIVFFPEEPTTEQQNDRSEDRNFVSVVSRALKATNAKGM